MQFKATTSIEQVSNFNTIINVTKDNRVVLLQLRLTINSHQPTAFIILILMSLKILMS